MTIAMDLLGADSDWDHQACVGHTLKLSVHAGLNESSIAKMLSIARITVGHSANACSNIHKVQEQNGKKKTQSCARRVNEVEFHIPYARPSHLREHCGDDMLEQSDHSHLKLSGTQWDLAKQDTALLNRCCKLPQLPLVWSKIPAFPVFTQLCMA